MFCTDITKHILVFFVLPLFFSKGPSESVPAPYGVLMCRRLCEQTAGCRNWTYEALQLLCDIQKGNEINLPALGQETALQIKADSHDENSTFVKRRGNTNQKGTIEDHQKEDNAYKHLIYKDNNVAKLLVFYNLFKYSVAIPGHFEKRNAITLFNDTVYFVNGTTLVELSLKDYWKQTIADHQSFDKGWLYAYGKTVYLFSSTDIEKFAIIDVIKRNIKWINSGIKTYQVSYIALGIP